MKSCYVIYGNIASGKTTFSKSINELLPNFNFVCIDEIRVNLFKKYPEMNSISRERKAEEECLNKILNSEFLIFETSAASLFYKRLAPRIKAHFKTYFIYINCPNDECLQRFHYRKKTGYLQIATPYKNKMSVFECISNFSGAHYSMKKDLELNSAELSTNEMVDKFREFINR